MRLPVNLAWSTGFDSGSAAFCFWVVSWSSSPFTFAVMVSTISFLSLSLETRVRTRVSPSRVELVTGTTLPPPQRMVVSILPSFAFDAEPAGAASGNGECPAADEGIFGGVQGHAETKGGEGGEKSGRCDHGCWSWE